MLRKMRYTGWQSRMRFFKGRVERDWALLKCRWTQRLLDKKVGEECTANSGCQLVEPPQ